MQNANPPGPPPRQPIAKAPVGWISYLYGDETPITPQVEAAANHVMYDSINQNGTFYRPSFARFIENVFRDHLHIPIPNLQNNGIRMHTNDQGVPYGYPNDPVVAELRYYYNRQLIYQMTNIPQKTIYKEHPFYNYPSIPLSRRPKQQLQCDIMYWINPFAPIPLQAQKYVLVIEEIFSRYAWAAVVQPPLNAANVARAFLQALEGKAGFSTDYFHAIENNITNITFDAGSEFRGQFIQRIKQGGRFPNAKFYMAAPKHLTFGNPSNTGPVESAIRMIRRTIRDQMSAVNSQDRLQNILDRSLQMYNRQHQLETLQNNAPLAVAYATRNNYQPLLQRLQNHMNRVKQEKLDLKNQFVQQLNKPIQDPGIGYRIYLKQSAFVKEEDIRVSLQVYHILHQTPYYVDLIEVRPAHRAGPQHPPQVLTNILWQSLVEVKLPVMDGPGQIGVRIRRQFANRAVTPGNARLGTPHTVDRNLPYALPAPLQPNPGPAAPAPRQPAPAQAQGQGPPGPPPPPPPPNPPNPPAPPAGGGAPNPGPANIPRNGNGNARRRRPAPAAPGPQRQQPARRNRGQNPWYQNGNFQLNLRGG